MQLQKHLTLSLFRGKLQRTVETSLKPHLIPSLRQNYPHSEKIESSLDSTNYSKREREREREGGRDNVEKLKNNDEDSFSVSLDR